MRAAFKAVIEGKQVAVLAPTTVLTFQHLRTLTERFAGFPVKIDMVSGFRTQQEQKAILAQVAAGQVGVKDLQKSADQVSVPLAEIESEVSRRIG